MPPDADGRSIVSWGRRASPSELARWRSRLGPWKEPARFRRTVEAMRRVHRDHVLDQPGSIFRETHIASRCASILGATAVRLGSDPPDFELRLGDREVQCEAVEALAPGRRRGAELKDERRLTLEARWAPRHVPSSEWTSAADALSQIEAVAKAKSAKGYPEGTVLVIYLNVGFAPVGPPFGMAWRRRSRTRFEPLGRYGSSTATKFASSTDDEAPRGARPPRRPDALCSDRPAPGHVRR